MAIKVSKTKTTKSRVRASGDATDESCPHCIGGEETYGYYKRSWVYDVDRAREIVSDGRDAVELDSDDVRYLVDSSRIYAMHLDHVDTQFPGILAHLWGPGADGAWEHGHLLIDGNNRAARCMRDGLPFFAYLLTEEESEQILNRGPGRDGTIRDSSKNQKVTRKTGR